MKYFFFHTFDSLKMFLSGDFYPKTVCLLRNYINIYTHINAHISVSTYDISTEALKRGSSSVQQQRCNVQHSLPLPCTEVKIHHT